VRYKFAIITRAQISVAAQNALVGLAAYVAGFYFTALFHSKSSAMGGFWSVISAIVVLQATTRETWKSALLRVRGTLIGAIIGCVYLYFFAFNPIGMALSMGVTVLFCDALNVPDHGRLAAVTVALIMVLSSLIPEMSPFANAALRFVESAIGAGIAVLAVMVWPQSE
jgi:uncharacterized membrane protein YccC